MDKIFIKNLTARGIIGINDWEREKPQEIVMNITLFSDVRHAGKTDQIEDSVNYRTVAKQALAIAETGSRHTVEALATDLAKMCLSQAHVQKVIVRVEKPGAVRFSDSVGVEIERTQEDFA
ncbi:MAG: dihydroneopterin aldolase [Chloroflexota bacterium]